jgi:hypothetical protein
MKALLYLVGTAILAAGVVLVAADFPIEAKFPTAGPTAISFGAMVLIALFYLSHTNKI